ncbi:hypothetical protein BG000_003763 [Podila horticola]|nr:hypothetical protein BG000_003763 [Podila horticola]
MNQLANFPHIVEDITASFSFTDLANSVLVSRAWYDVISPILYLDVMTFRKYRFKWDREMAEFRKMAEFSEMEEFSDVEEFANYFNASDTRLALHKHCHHIRAITAKARIFSWNFRVPNPGLRAVSIEGVIINSDKDLDALTRFARFLDEYPSIICFFLEIEEETSPNTRKVLLEILEKRLTLIKEDSVECLDFAPGTGRSNRGPPWRKGQQQSWPAREQRREIWSGVVSGYPTLGYQTSHGRWENQTKSKNWSWRTLAVMKKGDDGLLEVRFWDPSATTLFQRFAQVRKICGKMDHGDKCSLSALKDLAKLKEIDICSNNHSERQVEQLLQDQHLNLSAVHVEVENTAFAEFLLRRSGESIGGRWIPGLMVSLVFDGWYPLEMSKLLQILALCPNLGVLKVATVLIDGPESILLGTCPLWASKKLKTLRFGFWLHGHANDNHVFDVLPEETKTQSLESASKIAPSFMEQLGQQTEIRSLELSFNAVYRCGSSPFLQLTIGPPNGLHQLSGLHRLEYFSVTGLIHDIGSKEIEWMSRHWPRLKKIQFPILDTKDKTTLTISCYDRLIPNFEPWYPFIEVVKICGSHHLCHRCEREKTIFAENSRGLEDKWSYGRRDHQYNHSAWTSVTLADHPVEYPTIAKDSSPATSTPST